MVEKSFARGSDVTSTEKTADSTIVLAPSYKLPLALVAIGLGLYWVSLWAAIPVALFGMFLGIQATILRLHFTNEAFELYRGQEQLRCFPYAEWLNWEIYFGLVPILFYFREVKSIHFLPIVFNASQLKGALEMHSPKTDSAAPQQ